MPSISDSPEDIADIAESIRSYMNDILTGIADCAVKIRDEEDRTDRLHRARLNKLKDELEGFVEQYASSRAELQELQQTRRLTQKQKEGLEFLRRFKR